MADMKKSCDKERKTNLLLKIKVFYEIAYGVTNKLYQLSWVITCGIKSKISLSTTTNHHRGNFSSLPQHSVKKICRNPFHARIIKRRAGSQSPIPAQSSGRKSQ